VRAISLKENPNVIKPSWKMAACILLGAASYAGAAPVPWRTPQIKNTTNSETVSCDLLNVSGHNITVSNLIIRVQSLEGDLSSEVISIPGPQTIADGRGLRGSSPTGALANRTVYCELDPGSVISVKEASLLFTSTMDDGTNKVVTTATPVKGQ
jgi:hypothetical protein